MERTANATCGKDNNIPPPYPESHCEQQDGGCCFQIDRKHPESFQKLSGLGYKMQSAGMEHGRIKEKTCQTTDSKNAPRHTYQVVCTSNESCRTLVQQVQLQTKFPRSMLCITATHTLRQNSSILVLEPHLDNLQIVSFDGMPECCPFFAILNGNISTMIKQGSHGFALSPLCSLHQWSQTIQVLGIYISAPKQKAENTVVSLTLL